MATQPSDFRLGCTVTVPASRFDVPGEERWSVQQFGEEADTKVLECVIVRQVRHRWKVLVRYDNDYQTLESEALTHTAATCPKCQSEGFNNDQSPDPGPVVMQE